MDAYQESIINLYSYEQYQLPIQFKSDDLKKEITDLLSSYINSLKTIGIDDSVIYRLRKFKKSINRMFSNYLGGVHSRAYYNFEQAIKNLQLLESKLLVDELEDELLFRGRINTETKDFCDKEMFHIPLNKRGVVSTQRFSFPGLPCIYACASAYPCWVELNRPSFESLQMATLRPRERALQKKVFDISHVPQNIDAIIDEDWFDINEYALYWPLIAMCSISVNHEDYCFKPEYIFPQFLLQYILSSGTHRNKFIGIKYASIKVASISGKQLSDDWHTFTCYAFPSQTTNMKDEMCRYLTELFQIQKTRSGKELQILSKVLSIDKAKLKTEIEKENLHLGRQDKDAVSWNIYTHDGKAYPYELSEFGMIEKAMKLDDFDFNPEDSVIQYVTEEEIDAMIQKNL